MATRTGRLQFAVGEDTVFVENDVAVGESSSNKHYRSRALDSAQGSPPQRSVRWQQDSSAGMGTGMAAGMAAGMGAGTGADTGAGMGARSKSSITFSTPGGGNSGAAGSVQQELANVEMTRSKSDFALERVKSKKEIKTEKTTKFYKDLTDALHTKVADFMVGVSHEDDDEDEFEELKRDVASTMKALEQTLMTEVQQRERGERVVQEQLERQGARFDALRVMQDRLSEIQNVVGKVNERVKYLEDFFGPNVEKLGRDVEALKSGNQIQAAKIQELEQRCNDCVDHVHHFMDGNGQLENKLESTFRNYSDELDSKCGHLATKHGEHTENLNKVQRDLTRIGAEVEDRHSNLVKSLEDSINEALSKTHAMIVTANKEGADTAKDLAALRSEVDEQHQKVATVDEACNGHARDLKRLAESSAEMGTGLNQLKSSVDRLASNTASEVKANRDELDQLCNSLYNVSRSWSSNTWSRRPVRCMMSPESHAMEIRTGGA